MHFPSLFPLSKEFPFTFVLHGHFRKGLQSFSWPLLSEASMSCTSLCKSSTAILGSCQFLLQKRTKDYRHRFRELRQNIRNKSWRSESLLHVTCTFQSCLQLISYNFCLLMKGCCVMKLSG